MGKRRLERNVRQLLRQVSVILTLSSILVYMRHNRLPVDGVGCDTLLIGTYGRNNAEGSRVDLLTTVADDADDHFLPTILIPDLAARRRRRWGVDEGESNGTQPNGERPVAGGDGMCRGQGYGSCGVIGGTGHPPNWGSWPFRRLSRRKCSRSLRQRWQTCRGDRDEACGQKGCG